MRQAPVHDGRNGRHEAYKSRQVSCFRAIACMEYNAPQYAQLLKCRRRRQRRCVPQVETRSTRTSRSGNGVGHLVRWLEKRKRPSYFGRTSTSSRTHPAMLGDTVATVDRAPSPLANSLGAATSVTRVEMVPVMENSMGLFVKDKTAAITYEEERLKAMGYSQVLHRGWRWFTNVAVTISSMSVLLSITGSFTTGLSYGGPIVCLWGWWLVALLSLCVALGMAELASAYPTSGGMYYWIFQLVDPSYGPMICWVTGWLNLLGQIASLASTHYFMANTISVIVLLSTGTATPQLQPGFEPATDDDVPAGPGWYPTNKQMMGIYTACLLFTATINSLRFEHVGWITELGAWWTILGVIIIMIAIPCITVDHAEPNWVFRKFESNNAAESGVHNPFYVFILGLLLPAYSFTGYDGPAHMSEETTNASLAAPWGIMLGVVFMIVVGWSWVLSLLFCVTDLDQVLGSQVRGTITVPSEAGEGNPIAQIFWNAFKQRTGSGTGGIIMLMIPLGGIYFCAHSTLTYVSRILFAYSRDRAVPLAWAWIKYNKTVKGPLIAVWGTAFAAFLLGLPMLGSEEAFTAIISLSTIALNIAYVAPTTARILPWGARRFKPGPFHLGWAAYPIGTIATLWVGFIVVVFSLPTEYPTSSLNLNYAGVTLLATFALSLIWYYFPFIGAYTWFKGPVSTLEEEPMGVDPEVELGPEGSCKAVDFDAAASTAVAVGAHRRGGTDVM